MPIYKSRPFDGYTHRFTVNLYNGSWISVDVYSDSGSIDDLTNHINSSESAKDIASFYAYRSSTKEQDDWLAEYVDTILSGRKNPGSETEDFLRP